MNFISLLLIKNIKMKIIKRAMIIAIMIKIIITVIIKIVVKLVLIWR